MTALCIALAGALGAVTRFGLDAAVRARRQTDFPWATVVINVSGSFVLGIVTGFVLFHGVDPRWRLILGVGFCGGYTTFSTASFETVRLAQKGRYGVAAVNGLGTLASTAGAAAVGLLLAQ